MPDLWFQAMLFDGGTEFTHWFYIWTNGLVDKPGMAKDVEKRRKGDPQYKGMLLAIKRLCGCALPTVNDRPKCEHELRWERYFAADRLPSSEQYRRSEDVKRAERWYAGTDRRANAVLDWADRNGLSKTA